LTRLLRQRLCNRLESVRAARGTSMRTSDDEVVRLIDEIHAVALELGVLRKRGAHPTELEAKESELERLRWRLAASARRAARDGLGDAA
jgi:hypothetical protein